MIYDVTKNLFGGMSVYPGDPAFASSTFLDVGRDGVNVTAITMGSHTGTHIDAPRHLFSDGKGLSDYPPERFLGEAIVADLSDAGAIGAAHLRKLSLRAGDKLLIKTIREERRAPLQTDAARYLAQIGVGLLGIDAMSPEDDENSLENHKILLGGDILIIENLDLSAVPPGRYSIFAQPVLLAQDGGPVRAILSAI